MVNQISDEGYLSRPTIYPERSRGIGSGGTSLGSEEARQSLVTIHRSLALKYLPMNTKPLHLDMHEQIECAYTLASRFYTDPTVLEIEKEKTFRRIWQLVGTTMQPCGEVNGAKKTIADPETYFTAEIAGEPILIIRDKQGTLRAFSNVCRHRAGPIALGSGCKNVMRCQYHGWTYTLDGRLIGTPDIEGVEFFDRSTMGMFPLRLETWERFIFVNFDPR